MSGLLAMRAHIRSMNLTVQDYGYADLSISGTMHGRHFLRPSYMEQMRATLEIDCDMEGANALREIYMAAKSLVEEKPPELKWGPDEAAI